MQSHRAHRRRDATSSKIQEIKMLDTLLARFRTWQVQLTTINLLSNVDDRLLTDMGIERDKIVDIARANRAKADRSWSEAHDARPAARSSARSSCEEAPAHG
jgi:uncharacterized protein YjiS (DUF1127 family)